MTDKEIGKIAFDKFGLQECDEEYTYFVLGYKEAIKKQFAITDVVASLPVVEIEKVPEYLKDVLDYVNESLPNKIKPIDIINRIHLAKDKEALLNR